METNEEIINDSHIEEICEFLNLDENDIDITDELLWPDYLSECDYNECDYDYDEYLDLLEYFIHVYNFHESEYVNHLIDSEPYCQDNTTFFEDG